MKEKLKNLLNVLYPYIIGFVIGVIFSVVCYSKIIDTYNDYSNHQFNLQIGQVDDIPNTIKTE